MRLPLDHFDKIVKREYTVIGYYASNDQPWTGVIEVELPESQTDVTIGDVAPHVDEGILIVDVIMGRHVSRARWEPHEVPAGTKKDLMTSDTVTWDQLRVMLQDHEVIAPIAQVALLDRILEIAESNR